MQDCIRKVDTKAVMTVKMKLPIFSAGMFLKNFITINIKIILFILQGKPCWISNFLWRRESSKETSTLTKPSPIWEGCN